MNPKILVLSLLLAGCAATPPQPDLSQLPVIPAEFRQSWTVAAPAAARPRGEWWKAFDDPVLDGLLERANRANGSIRIAASRLAQARAVARATDAARSPQVGAGASAERGRNLIDGAPGETKNLFRAGVDLGYEVDLFGRLARATDAAQLDAESRQGLLESARLLVQADTARTYFALRALDVEAAIVRGTVTTYRETLSLTERRWRAGDVAELDFARAASELAETESEALALERRRAELEHALAVLVGEVPASFRLAVDDWNSSLPVIPAGVPATVLTRRPDVSAAQNAMLAAQARVGVAQAAWFPSVALTASAGYASPELSDLFKWSARAWGIGLLASLPLFDGGRRQAGIDAAAAELDGALVEYRESILGAFKDVEDQLAALRLLSEQAEAQARAVAAASRSTSLSDARYRAGYVSQLELLDALRSELRNRRQALQVRGSRFQATVALVRALGGSWQ